MAKRKNFETGGPTTAPVPIFLFNTSEWVSSARLNILLPDGRIKHIDYSEYLHLGFDDTVLAIVGVLRAMAATGKPKPLSLESIAHSGLTNWWQFCKERAERGNAPFLKSINRSTIESYAEWLTMKTTPTGELWSKNTARTAFTKTKTILKALVERKILLEEELFPRYLFPGATSTQNRRRYIHPLSDTERERILRPLSREVAQVFDGRHPGSTITQLGLCVFAIFLKTGVNATPFLELPRDLELCFMDHPRVNRKVMITFKRRAGAFTTTPLNSAETKVVSLDVYKLCQRVVAMTEREAALAIGTQLEGKLWIYQTTDGALRTLSPQTLSGIASAFSERNKLVRDDGSHLKMSSQLFRNTKINRVWRASKGDLLATAKSASNTPTMAERYLTVTPDMLEEHRLAGEVLVDMLSDKAERDATPHSGCKDSLNGELAPKNGEHCIDFLSCFRCKSQVIIQDDLHKLFSFYWALFEQRSRVGPDNWKKLFAWIVRVIDRDISPKFPPTIVVREKERARIEPHPMWRSNAVQSALRSIL